MITIKQKQVKPVGNRLYLEVELSDRVPLGWQDIYETAITKLNSYTSSRGLGGPVINRVRFQGNLAVTNDFPEAALSETKGFLQEFENVLQIANNIYEARIYEQKQRELLAKQEELERSKKIEEYNKWLND